MKSTTVDCFTPHAKKNTVTYLSAVCLPSSHHTANDQLISILCSLLSSLAHHLPCNIRYKIRILDKMEKCGAQRAWICDENE